MVFYIVKKEKDIFHHGILGQKWGVRRTPEQLGHTKNKAIKDINTVIKSFNKSDYKDFDTKNIRDYKIMYDKKKPIAFAYNRPYKIEEGLGVVMSIGVDPKYRGTGIAKKIAMDVIKKAEKDKEVKEITWAAEKDNTGSINTAKAIGFTHWYDYEGITVYKK